MATRRHIRAAWFCLLAALLISPPLTSAVADGLGIDLTHHHCDADDHSVLASVAHDSEPSISHDAAEVDPYTCDHCHVVFAALMIDAAISIPNGMPLPLPDRVTALSAVRVSPAFKPPIA
ncbi:MAG: hypothetical protein RIF37_10650 [Rhodospirillaceae bacterium]|jgi:hypothetical protein